MSARLTISIHDREELQRWFYFTIITMDRRKLTIVFTDKTKK